jgi:AraC family transcriptional regulator of adaptative response / DNA-3-methyladenine glycosylase II
LRRVFEDEYGVSPVQYLQTRRLLLAKSLLTDTELPIGHVAKSAGFGSARRMTELFTKHYKLSPRDFRKQNSDTQSGLHSNVKSDLCSNVKFDLHSNVKSDLHSNVKPNSQQDVQSSAKSRKQLLDEHGITLLLGYRPPFNWQQLLSFLAGRTIAGVEAVCDNAYLRTVCIENAKGWIVIRHRDDKQALAVTISESLLPVLERVLARVRFLFDLNASPTAITNGLADFEALEPGLHINGIRVPGCFDAFEMAVRAILGQQITVKAAQTLAGRMASALGSPIKTPFSELNIIFPSASIIASIPEPVADTLGPLGITGNRCKCICALAHALQDGSLTLSLSCNVHEEMQKLSELPGFGPWTVQYVALRALGFSDAFPHTDYGVKKALEALAAKGRIAQEVAKNPKLIIELSRAWMPWRSYATLDLWHSLE